MSMIDHEFATQAWENAKYFKITERGMKCPCPRCKDFEMQPWHFDPVLIEGVDRMREDLGLPIIVNRAASCWAHHKEVCHELKKPFTKNSAHIFDPEDPFLYVRGMDLTLPARFRRDNFENLVVAASRIGWNGLITYPEQLFIHIDNKQERFYWGTWYGGKYVRFA